jgi:hypothetical protein
MKNGLHMPYILMDRRKKVNWIHFAHNENLNYNKSMVKIDKKYIDRLTYHKIVPASDSKRDKISAVFKQAFEAVSTFFFRVVYLIRYQKFETNQKLSELRVDLVEDPEREDLQQKFESTRAVILDTRILPLSSQQFLTLLQGEEKAKSENNWYILTDSSLQENTLRIQIPKGSNFMEQFLNNKGEKQIDAEVFQTLGTAFNVDLPRRGLKFVLEGQEYDLSDFTVPFPTKRISEILSEWVEKDPNSRATIESQLQLSPYREFMDLFKLPDETALQAVKRYYDQKIATTNTREHISAMLADAQSTNQTAEEAIAMKLIDIFCLLSQAMAAESVIHADGSNPLKKATGDDSIHGMRARDRRIAFLGPQLNQMVSEIDLVHTCPEIRSGKIYREKTIMTVHSLRGGGEYTISTGNDYNFSVRTPPEWIPKISSAS